MRTRQKPGIKVSLTGTLMPPVDHPIHMTPPHPERMTRKVLRARKVRGRI